jgi:hypothetical protein
MVAPIIAGGKKKKITKNKKGGAEEPVPYNSLEGGKSKKKVTKKTKGGCSPIVGGKKTKTVRRKKQKGGEGETLPTDTLPIDTSSTDTPVNTSSTDTPVNTSSTDTLPSINTSAISSPETSADLPPIVGGKRRKKGGAGLINTIFGTSKPKPQFNPNKPVIGNKLRTGPHKGKYIIKHKHKVYVCEHKK